MADPADLTTLADVKAWIGLAANATGDDALLSALITAQSKYIQSWLNRTFAVANYTERRDGTGRDTLIVGDYPLQSVTAVTVDGVPIPQSPDYVSSGWFNDDIGIYLIGYRFTRGRRNVLVSYTAGYPVLPSEIAQACKELVALRYKERERIGHMSKSIGGETVAFMVKDFPPDVLTILGNYKKVIPL